MRKVYQIYSLPKQTIQKDNNLKKKKKGQVI